MDELLQLLEALAGDGAVGGLTDEELAGALATLREGVEGIDISAPSAEEVELLGRVADAVDALEAETGRRSEETAARAADAADRMARIRAQRVEEEEQPVEETATTTGTEAEGEDAPDEGEAPQAIAAAAQRPARPSIGGLIRHRPAANDPRPRDPNKIGLRNIVAAAGAQGFAPGQTLTRMQLAEAIVNKATALRRLGPGQGEEIPVATVNYDFPEDRRLSLTDTAHNQRVLDSVLSHDAVRRNANQKLNGITAAGGFCAPLTVDYGVPTLSAANRPLRESGAAPVFGAAGRRGGLAFMTSPTLGDYTGALSAWTEADDISALDGSPTKPCVRVECGLNLSVKNEARPKCLTVGNFFDRTYPEMLRAILDILDADSARWNEERDIAVIGTAGTPVDGADGTVQANVQHVRRYTVDELLGTTRNLIAAFQRARANYEYVYRLPDGFPFRLLLPRWARNQVIVDLAREMPGASVDRLRTNPAFLGQLLGDMGFNVTWLWDGPSNQRFAHLASGNDLHGWPDVIEADMYPEGTWGTIDGGELNLGVVRSPELNEVNDLQIWSETFERTFWRGPAASWHLTLDVCPDGSTSTAVDIDPCTSGS